MIIGPGMKQKVELSGIDQMTFRDLRKFVDRVPSNVPEESPVELYTAAPDRPGERSEWSISVEWKEEDDR